MRDKLKTSRSKLQQKTKNLSSLLAVSEILSHLNDLSNLNTALGSALAKTLEIMREDTGSILLLDEEKQTLHGWVNCGLYQEDAPTYNLNKGIAGKVIHTGEPVLIKDISLDPESTYDRLIVTEGLHGFASFPLHSKEGILGVLNIASRKPRQFSSEDVQVLEGIARQIAIAVENARLHQEVQRKEAIRGELLQDIFSIQEEERKRIARELHDETSQVLASLSASLEAAAGMLRGSNRNEKVETILRKAQDLSVNILDEMHRLIYELRPSLLDDLGLVAAARWLVDNKLEAVGIKVDFEVSGRERRLSPQLETTLFRVIQEAVYNILKHAQARHASISLNFKKTAISVQIRDDGKGFDVIEAITSKERPRGLGLLGMKERVELVNGTLDIRSQPGNGGTEIYIKIPLKGKDSNG